jgi:hypothetical protein
MSHKIFGEGSNLVSFGLKFLKSSSRYSCDKMEESFKECFGENVNISDIKTNCKIFVTCATQK